MVVMVVVMGIEMVVMVVVMDLTPWSVKGDKHCLTRDNTPL
jgi:hypothetical protein